MRRGSLFLVPVLAAACLYATAGVSSAFLLPDSDQRKCYQAVSPYAEISCAGTGQDGAYIRNPLSYTDNGDGPGTVTDNNTGLIWQKEDDGEPYNWYQATGTYHADYNSTSFNACGSFGRLPSKKELMSIVDYAIPSPGPAIHPGFTNTKASYYWSSTSYAYAPSNAWTVGFHDGYVAASPKGNAFYVRCVRGGETPGPTLIDNGNDTVTDSRTGLIWQQGEPGTMTWGAALSYCEGLDLGGSTAWRLPNIKELESLTDDTRWDPAIDTSKCPNAHASYYWSSTSYAYGPHYAWTVYFYNGNVSAYGKYSAFYVRCVRGGQSGLDPTIAQTPMAGPAGTTFAQWGTGFTPNGTATLHFFNPYGEENLPPLVQPLDGSGNFSISYASSPDKPAGYYKWWAVNDTTGVISNEIVYQITGAAGREGNLRISQYPTTGKVGSVFQLNGWNFTPNSLAMLHFSRPYGSEYATYQAIDGVGRFSIPYTVPGGTPDGIYTWWAEDEVRIGWKSSEVQYAIDTPRRIVADNFRITNTGTVSSQFEIWLDVSVDDQRPGEDFCNQYRLEVTAVSKAPGVSIIAAGACGWIGDGTMPNSSRYRQYFTMTSDGVPGNPVWFENGALRIVPQGGGAAQNMNIENLNSFAVYGTNFDVTEHAWKFANGSWRMAQSGSEIFKAADTIDDYIAKVMQPAFWHNLGEDGWIFDHWSDGLCYGLTNSAIATFNNDDGAWGTGSIDQWQQDIESHWDSWSDQATPPFQALPNHDIHAMSWDIDSAKKIMYYHVGNQGWTRSSKEPGNWVEHDFIEEVTDASDIADLLRGGSPASFYFNIRGGGAHEVAVTQLITHNDTDAYMIWDNNNPSGKLGNDYGPYLSWTVEPRQDYEKAVSCGTSQGIYSVSKDGQPGKIKYKLAGLPGYVTPSADPQNIYGLRSSAAPQVAQKSPATVQEAGAVASSLPERMTLTVIGGRIDQVADKVTGVPITLVPNGDPAVDQAVIVSTMVGLYNLVELPVDGTYLVEATKFGDVPILKVFVRIPQVDGTVETINYETVQTGEADATKISFTVGRGNTDKAIQRTIAAAGGTKAGRASTAASDYLPDYDETVTTSIPAPKDLKAGMEGTAVRLSWTNSPHPNLAAVRIMRTIGAYPAGPEDGTTVYEGLETSILDSGVVEGPHYFYAAFSLDGSGAFSSPALATVNTYLCSIFGKVALGTGEGVAEADVVLVDGSGTTVATDLSGADGTYRLSNLEMNAYNLQVSHPSHVVENAQRDVTLGEESREENFTAEPVFALSLLFDLPSVEAGTVLWIPWSFRHIGNEESVQLELQRGGVWDTLADGVPILNGQIQWNVVVPVEAEAKLRITLVGNPAVYDERTFEIRNDESQSPSAVDDAATTAANKAVAIPVLANDSDGDGDPIAVAEVGTPGHGTATTDGTTVTYTPAAGFSGSDSFTYTASDGNGGTSTATVTVTVTPVFKVRSSGALDGWILESTETSGKGGTMNAVASTIRIGDDASDRQYRGILSFDTSGLPDNAVISSATLRVRKQAIVGRSPFWTHGMVIIADMVKGSFSGNKALKTTDFSAVATRQSAVSMPEILTLGWYTGNLGPKAIAAINKTGPTQFRLRFSRDDDDDGRTDYLSIYSGNAAAANRPVLEIGYSLP